MRLVTLSIRVLGHNLASLMLSCLDFLSFIGCSPSWGGRWWNPETEWTTSGPWRPWEQRNDTKMLARRGKVDRQSSYYCILCSLELRIDAWLAVYIRQHVRTQQVWNDPTTTEYQLLNYTLQGPRTQIISTIILILIYNLNWCIIKAWQKKERKKQSPRQPLVAYESPPHPQHPRLAYSAYHTPALSLPTAN